MGSIKIFLQNHWTNFNQTWYKSAFGKGDSRLFKGRGALGIALLQGLKKS
jgi:hypothetical protein